MKNIKTKLYLYYFFILDMLIPCHKVSIARLFDRGMSRQSSTTSNLSKTSSVEHFEDPFAVQHLCFCPYSRLLTVVTSSFLVVTFQFSSKEKIIETPVNFYFISFYLFCDKSFKIKYCLVELPESNFCKFKSFFWNICFVYN